MDGGIIAFVLMVVDVGKEDEVADALRQIGVNKAEVVYGEYDVLCRIEASSVAELDEIAAKLRRLPNIIRTVTLLGTRE